MATYHNCSRGYLWSRGFAPFIVWVLVGVIGYGVYFSTNSYVVKNGGLWVMLVWDISIIYIFYRWYKHLQLQSDKEITWAHGWVGEHVIGKSLRNLSNDWHIFFDVRLPTVSGNIDFVLVSKFGVYAVEVKNWSRFIHKLYWSRIGRRAWVQTRNEAAGLYEVLAEFHPHWIQAIIVFANQATCSPREQGKLHVLGRDEIRQYFAHEELDTKNKLSDEQISGIVTTLEHLAECKTHKH